MAYNMIFLYLLFIAVYFSSSNLISDEDVADRYKKNSNLIESAAKVCENHSGLKRVDWEFGGPEIDFDGEKDALTNAEFSLLAKVKENVGVEQFSCLRTYDIERRGKLDSVAFAFFEKRIGIAVRAKSILYVIDVPPGWMERVLNEGILRPLGRKNWYIKDSE